MQRAGRVHDHSLISSDNHGCSSCPHLAKGPATSGSADVLIDGRRALRAEDTGLHESCCGSGEWTAVGGAPRVLINNRLAHRTGDITVHCGGLGKLITGSQFVHIGNYKKHEKRTPNTMTEISFDIWGHRLDGKCDVIYDDGTTERITLKNGFARIYHPQKTILRVVLDID